MATLIEVKNLKKYFKSAAGMVHAVDDVSFTIEEGEAVGLADWLVLNELELAALTGEEDPMAGVSRLTASHPEKKLVLTLGKEGSLFAGDGAVLRQPALPILLHIPGDLFPDLLLKGLPPGSREQFREPRHPRVA